MPSSLTRREILRLSVALASAGAGSALLGACGSSSGGSPPPANAATATPARGGTVRLAFGGGGAAETLDPFKASTPADLARNFVVFDRLFTLVDGQVTPALAVSAKPAPDARSFVMTLRDDVRWHDGSTLSAADVAYSLNYVASPESTAASELPAYLDIPNIAVAGDLTLEVPTLQPVGDPAALFAGASVAVVKDGASSFEPGQVIGTGAYRVEAFDPGREARLVRNDDYWGGDPYADELVVLSIDDPQARVNAVRGGQAGYASDIPYTMAETGAGGADVEVRDAGEQHRTSYGFMLNTTTELMSDPRVRMAIRLGIDRQALVDAVFLGNGVPANDLFGLGAQYFADDVPVLEREVDRAQTLLEDAGAIGARMVVRSAAFETGMNSSAELFVEQMRDLGLDASPQLVGLAEYFDPDAVGAAEAIAFPLGPHPLGVIFGRSAAYPSLAFDDPDLQDALGTAIASTDEGERQQAWMTAQQVMADRGNWVVWGRGDVLSLARHDLVGIQVRDSPKYPYLGQVGFAS